jgi:hypothetical protein
MAKILYDMKGILVAFMEHKPSCRVAGYYPIGPTKPKTQSFCFRNTLSIFGGV